MIGRIRDAIKTLLTPSMDERIEAERAALAALRTEARTLISEMDDTLEKFSRVVARQAKRRNRDMREAMSDEPPQPAPDIAPAPDDRAAHKAAIWARVRARNPQHRQVAE